MTSNFGGIKRHTKIISCQYILISRCLFIYPESTQRALDWELDFQEAISKGCRQNSNRVVDKTPLELVKGDKPASELDQYAFLSEISNDPYKPFLLMNGAKSTGHYNLDQLLLYQQVKDRPYRNCGDPQAPNFYPTSPRWRMLYDFVHPSTSRPHDYLKRMILDWLDNSQANGDQEFNPRVGKKRRERGFQTRIVTVDPELMDDPSHSTPGHGLPMQENFETQRTVYENFVEDLILYGKVKFRSITNDGCVLIMNSYTQNYVLCENSFEHITFRKEEDQCSVICTCGEYDFYLGSACEVAAEADKTNIALSSDLTCFHCSIVFDLLFDVCKNPESLDNEPENDLMAKLADSRKEMNNPVLVVSKLVPGQTMKMSVQGGDDSPYAFVNLTGDRSRVECQHGYCQCIFHARRITKEHAAKKRKKKSQERLDDDCLLDSAICVHLQTLWLYYEDWEYLRSSESMDGENFNKDDIDLEQLADDQEVNFDVKAQIWINRARSKHKPNEENDENYKRYYIHVRAFVLLVTDKLYGNYCLLENILHTGPKRSHSIVYTIVHTVHTVVYISIVTFRNVRRRRELYDHTKCARSNDGHILGPDLYPELSTDVCPCGVCIAINY